MNLEIGDIITIDDKKNIVLTIFFDDEIEYAFINEVTDDEEDITDTYYIIKVNSDNTYTKLNDEEEINRLYPKLQRGLKLSMDALGIDINDNILEG